MTALPSLWLPILVSSVLVFVVSSAIHMASPWHKSDYPKLPNEGRVMDALRPLAIPAGDYMMPRASNRQEMRSPEFAEKMKKGPVMMLTVWPGGSMAMGTHLGGGGEKVVGLVGASTESWERAAAAAVRRAAKTLRGLRVAEISQLDMQLKDGKVESYRAKLKVSFKYEGD